MVDKTGSDIPTNFALESPDNLLARMDAIYQEFRQALGLPTVDDPTPSRGYKWECDPVKRDEYVGRAIRLRNAYAEISMHLGTGGDVLSDMTKKLSLLGVIDI